MAVRNMVRELSYGQSGVSSYEYGCGSGRIGVTENQDCQGAHKEWKYGALMQALFDAEREEGYRASDHVSITDHEHT